MKKIKFLLSGIAVVVFSALQAQTADEIIAKYVEAIGGKDKISQVKSLYTEATMEVMGNQAPVVEYLLQGKGFKTETDFQGSKIIQCITDKGGWSINPMAGATEAMAMPEEQYKGSKDQIFLGGALVDYAAKGNKIELLGKEENAYKIKVLNGTTESTYFIDGNTYYITKTTAKGEMMGQPVEVVVTLSDHQKTDFGIVLPFSRNIDLGGFSMSAKVNKVEFNKEIDPKIFEQPK
jgi:hypothetical protein